MRSSLLNSNKKEMINVPEFPFPEEDIIATEYYGKHSHPHEIFKWLRANDPLRYFSPEGFAPFWAATSHDDIVEIESSSGIVETVILIVYAVLGISLSLIRITSAVSDESMA